MTLYKSEMIKTWLCGNWIWLMKYFLMIVISFCLTSCETTRVRMLPQVSNLGIERKIPIEAGLFITEETKSYVFRGRPESYYGWNMEHYFPLGSSLEEASLQVFSQVFEKVTVVRKWSQSMKNKIVIEPQIEDFHFSYPFYYSWEVHSASRIKLKIYIWDNKNSKIWEKSLESPEIEVISQSGIVDSYYAGLSASNALVQTLQKLTEDMVKDPVINNYLASMQDEIDLAGDIPKKEFIIKVNGISDVPNFGDSPRGDDLAIIIGIEKYQNVLNSEFSNKDADLMKTYLKAIGFLERNIEFITNDRATKSGIEKAIEAWLPNRVKKDSKIYVYYSGHGAPEPATGEAYIVPYDGDPNYLSITGYPLKRLYDRLGKLQAQEVVVLLDSCFSGTGGRSVLAKGARPVVMLPGTAVLPSNMVVLTATHGSQISTSAPEKEHGVFTYYFLKALKDGKKELSEIYEYIKPLIEDEAKSLNVSQSPSITPESAKIKGKFNLRQ